MATVTPARRPSGSSGEGETCSRLPFGRSLSLKGRSPATRGNQAQPGGHRDRTLRVPAAAPPSFAGKLFCTSRSKRSSITLAVRAWVSSKRLRFSPDLLAQCAQLRKNLLGRPRSVPDATERRFDVGTEDTDECFGADVVWSMQHVIRGVEHSAEEVQLLAEDLEHEKLGLVVLCQKVHHRYFVLLPVAVASTNPLFDALGIPRKVVINDGLAELQVQSFGARLRGDEDPRAGPELVHQCETHSHGLA